MKDQNIYQHFATHDFCLKLDIKKNLVAEKNY